MDAHARIFQQTPAVTLDYATVIRTKAQCACIAPCRLHAAFRAANSANHFLHTDAILDADVLAVVGNDGVAGALVKPAAAAFADG